MPRSMASLDISFMSPPPWPSRTTSFSLVKVSKRSPPTGRATTRWKLFVPMSSAASTGSSTCSSGVVTMSASDLRRAGLQPAQHTLAEAGDLLETSAQDVVGRTLVTDHQCRLDRLVEVARFDLRRSARRGPVLVGHDRLRPSAGHAVVDEVARLTLQRAAEGQLRGLAPRPAEDVADHEVPEAVVEILGQRLVQEHLV